MDEVYKPNQADLVLVEKEELDAIERKLQNQIEEVGRWRRKFSGDNLEYKLIKVDYIDGGSPIAYVTISLPLAFQLEIKDQAKQLVERVFIPYISHQRRYKLHFTSLAGWSVNLQLTEEELDTFQLPN
jgi:hypothetical protein